MEIVCYKQLNDNEFNQSISMIHVFLLVELIITKAASKLPWFQNVKSMLNYHLTRLLGLRSLPWTGYQIHVSFPINHFLKKIPQFLINLS
ncbi:hypothetical protein AAZX31_07G035700 [Glycine max]